MPRKGLSREAIIDTAAALAEQKGADNLTLRELAETLGVKTASLYNHLQGLPELNARLAECALDRLMDTLETAMAGRTGAEGLRALATAYRTFAREQPQLYRAMVSLPRFSDPSLVERKHAFMDLFNRVLAPCRLPDDRRIHLSRTIRSALHGYCALAAAGFFQSPLASPVESYEQIIEWLCQIVKEMEEQDHDKAFYQ